MKKQLLKMSVAFAAMLLVGGNAFAQLFAPVATGTVPAIVSGPMTIDGYADEADWSDAIDITAVVEAPDPLTTADMSGSMKLCWNYQGMYLFFTIQDNEAHNWNGTDGDSYMFDNVELFFNWDTAGVSTSGSYEPDGIQMRYNRGHEPDSGQPGWGAQAEKAEGYNQVLTQFKLVDNTTDWQVEIFVPWLYILPSGTLPEDIMDSVNAHKAAFGFEAGIGDSDGTDPLVGARDCILHWDEDAGTDMNNAWQDTKLFGILSLEGTPISAIKKEFNSNFEVYPNPVNNVLHFNNLANVSEITIVNTLGQTVKVVDVVTSDVAVNVSDLAKGTYVALIKSQKDTYTTKFVKK